MTLILFREGTMYNGHIEVAFLVFILCVCRFKNNIFPVCKRNQNIWLQKCKSSFTLIVATLTVNVNTTDLGQPIYPGICKEIKRVGKR